MTIIEIIGSIIVVIASVFAVSTYMNEGFLKQNAIDEAYTHQERTIWESMARDYICTWETTSTRPEPDTNPPGVRKINTKKCSYCGGNFIPDKRGNCSNCGGNDV